MVRTLCIYDDSYWNKKGGSVKEMRFIFVIMGLCIIAGILCVIFAVSQNIRGGGSSAPVQTKNVVAR